MTTQRPAAQKLANTQREERELVNELEQLQAAVGRAIADQDDQVEKSTQARIDGIDRQLSRIRAAKPHLEADVRKETAQAARDEYAATCAREAELGHAVQTLLTETMEAANAAIERAAAFAGVYAELRQTANRVSDAHRKLKTLVNDAPLNPEHAADPVVAAHAHTGWRRRVLDDLAAWPRKRVAEGS